MLRALAAPLAWAYGRAGELRRRAYERRWLPSFRLPAPVVSIGSLRAGGSGKTAIAAWVAARLASEGHRVGVVCGGYRGSDCRQAQLVPASVRHTPGAALRFGDEAVLLAGWMGQRALVTAGADKLAAAALAIKLGAEVIVVDDGFQHLRLARDLDLLLEEGPPPLPFPLGDGREEERATDHADLRWHHRRDGALLVARGAEVASRYLPSSLLDLDGTPRRESLGTLAGRRVCLLAGIARPEAFATVVAGLGARVCATIFVGDHREFDQRQLRAAARSGADSLLCTEKDAARIFGAYGLPRELLALRCEVELLGGEAVLDRALARALDTRPR